MNAPLEIRIAAKKNRTLVGEGITLTISQRVTAALKMETVELNRSRTTIRIQPLQGDLGTVTLSGADHLTLHRIHPLTQVGIAFDAPAGSAWNSDLNLLEYCRPLPVGRYKIAVSYRYGDSYAESIACNPVEVEVAPATLLSNELRWFGESSARDVLGSLWTALEGDRPVWFFQTCNKKDPSAVLTSVDLTIDSPPRDAKPCLAHLNDIASMHFERYAVWIDGERLCWAAVADTGRIAPQASAVHGLGSGAELADPPLQRRSGGFSAVVQSVQSGAVLIRVSADGSTEIQACQPAAGRLVAWSEADEPIALGPIEFDGGRVVATVLDQWLGAGHLLVAMEAEHGIEIARRGFDAATSQLENDVVNLDRLPVGFLRGEPLDASSLANSGGLALLFASDSGWSVLTKDRNFRAAARGGSIPKLIGAPSGLFLMEHSTERGFLMTRLGEAPPPDPL